MTALPLRPDAKDHRGRRSHRRVGVCKQVDGAGATDGPRGPFIGILAALMTYRTGMANRLESLDLQTRRSVATMRITPPHSGHAEGLTFA